MEVTLPAL